MELRLDVRKIGVWVEFRVTISGLGKLVLQGHKKNHSGEEAV